MPGTDRTGPRGDGPMTGQGIGRCTGRGVGNAENRRGFGRGFSQGGGRFRTAGRRGWVRGIDSFSEESENGAFQRILATLQSIVGRLDKLEK